jgi:hypothetical protein
MCYSDSISSQHAEFSQRHQPYKGRFTPDHREMLRLVAGTGVAGRLGGVTRAARFQARQAAVRGVRFSRSAVARWKA